MKVKIQKNTYIVTAKSQYELAISFMRLQEFYESSFDDIRGHYFTTEQYMDRYAEEFGNFTYTKDWDGFNIPGYIVTEFFNVFKDDLTKHEQELKTLLAPALNPRKKVRFYVIGLHGTGDDSVVNHEKAHAMYYLSTEFNSAMCSHISNISPFIKNRILVKLKTMGYGENVLVDEMQAYLSTSSWWYLIKKFKFVPIKTVRAMRKTFLKFKNQRTVVEK